MEQLVSRIFDVFSLEYIFVVIVASYFIIKLIDHYNGKRIVTTLQKRLITLLVGAASLVVFVKFGGIEFTHLMASYFAAVFFYDTMIKYLLDFLQINYKKDANDN